MVTPLRTVHDEDKTMGYKFGNFKQAASSNQDWYYLELEQSDDTIPPYCRHFVMLLKKAHYLKTTIVI